MRSRRMPVEKNWFDKKINDLLYGFLQASASFNKEEKKLYYPKTQFQKEKKILMKLIGCADFRTLKSKVATLIKEGYLAEDDENYYFPYNYDNHYLLMDKDLLYYICTTMSEFSVKTYVYLADKARGFKDYHFTIAELRVAFGYSANSQNANVEKIIGNCLALLKEAKLIKYHTEYVDIASAKGAYKAPNLVLEWVETSLPKTTEESIKEVAKTAEFVF